MGGWFSKQGYRISMGRLALTGLGQAGSRCVLDIYMALGYQMSTLAVKGYRVFFDNINVR